MPTAPPPDPVLSSDICTRCGICCNGALFNYGDLEEEEVQTVEQAGLRVKRVEGKARFLLPCSRVLDNRCTVYAVRPAICRSYRCQLLNDFQAGEISAEDAHARVEEAKRLVSKVRELLPEGEDLASARDAWSRAHAANTSGEDRQSPPADPQLTLSLFMLNRILDRHFRRATQRMMPWGDEDQRESKPRPAPKSGPRPPS